LGVRGFPRLSSAEHSESLTSAHAASAAAALANTLGVFGSAAERSLSSRRIFASGSASARGRTLSSARRRFSSSGVRTRARLRDFSLASGFNHYNI